MAKKKDERDQDRHAAPKHDGVEGKEHEEGTENVGGVTTAATPDPPPSDPPGDPGSRP